MNIKLISKDHELSSLCREVLAELPGHSSSLSTVGVEDAEGESDLCIWDFEPNLPISDLDPSRSQNEFGITANGGAIIVRRYVQVSVVDSLNKKPPQ